MNDSEQVFLAVTQATNLREQLSFDSGLLHRNDPDFSDLRQIAMRGDGDPERRWRATIALGKLHDAMAVGELIALTTDAAWEMRHSAVWSLCVLADAAALDTLTGICSSGKLDEQINYIAAMGLAAQFGEQGKQVLEGNLQHENASVRAWARCSLANVGYRE